MAVSIKEKLEKEIYNSIAPKEKISVPSLPTYCISDSSICGSFQTEAYCPLFCCNGCRLREVKLIYD